MPRIGGNRGYHGRPDFFSDVDEIRVRLRAFTAKLIAGCAATPAPPVMPWPCEGNQGTLTGRAHPR
jgi:hypothetical protein